MKRIKSVYEILKREIDWILSDIDLIAMLIAAPLFYSFFYGTMYMNKVEHKIPIAVYDEDHSGASLNLIKKLNAHHSINVKEKLINLIELDKKLINEDVEGVLFIPDDFSKNLKLNRDVRLKLYLNTHRFLHSNDLNKAVNEVALSMGEEIRVEYFNSKGFSKEQAKELSTPLKDDIKLLFNPSESYGDFLIPAILILVLQQTLFMGLGQSMAKENEIKKINELKNLSSYNPITAITGKISFYLILYLAYALLFFSLHLSVFKVDFKGSYSAFLIVSILLIISISFLSLIIGSFFSKKVHALILISFTTYPIFFFTGYSWPTFAMPQSAQVIGLLIPTTAYLKAVHRIVSMGANTSHIVFELISLSVLNVLLFSLVIKIFKDRFLKVNKDLQ
ncbi:MAG: ABC transporter permease [Ignavibacterium sp.]